MRRIISFLAMVITVAISFCFAVTWAASKEDFFIMRIKNAIFADLQSLPDVKRGVVKVTSPGEPVIIKKASEKTLDGAGEQYYYAGYFPAKMKVKENCSIGEKGEYDIRIYFKTVIIPLDLRSDATVRIRHETKGIVSGAVTSKEKMVRQELKNPTF